MDPIDEEAEAAKAAKAAAAAEKAAAPPAKGKKGDPEPEPVLDTGEADILSKSPPVIALALCRRSPGSAL